MVVKVSKCGHFFEYENESARAEPFFYLGDTVWMRFNKRKEDEAKALFSDRAAKGFTVIQSVFFRDLFVPNTPNVYGVTPFVTEEDMHDVRVNPACTAYVVKLTKIAAEYGIIMGILPTWGDKWNEHSNSAGPVIMDRKKAEKYGRYLSDSLAECENVIWILGGDSPIQKQKHADIVTAMAEGIRSGGSGGKLMTFHPCGSDSSDIFHTAPWLDFNAIQTSHGKPNIPGYVYIERLYAKRPAKPCLDMEPNYESSPMFVMTGQPERAPFEPVFSAYDVRKSFYRSVLAGAAGFTYGNEPIRQLHRNGDPIHIHTSYKMPTWYDSLSDPGSSQLKMFVDLLKERSYFTRVPAQELFIPTRSHGAWSDAMATGLDFAGQQNTEPVSRISVAKCSKGDYIIAYVPVRQVLTLDTSPIESGTLRVSLYDPEKCELRHRYDCPNSGKLTLVPERDMDTLVVLDRA